MGGYNRGGAEKMGSGVYLYHSPKSTRIAQSLEIWNHASLAWRMRNEVFSKPPAIPTCSLGFSSNLPSHPLKSQVYRTQSPQTSPAFYLPAILLVNSTPNHIFSSRSSGWLIFEDTFRIKSMKSIWRKLEMEWKWHPEAVGEGHSEDAFEGWTAHQNANWLLPRLQSSTSRAASSSLWPKWPWDTIPLPPLALF